MEKEVEDKRIELDIAQRRREREPLERQDVHALGAAEEIQQTTWL